MSEIFKIILSFFHNRNEGKMFVHPVTHDAHGLALKKRIRRSRILRLRQVAQATFFHSAAVRSSRSVFIVWKRSFLYDKKECALAHSRAEARLPRQPSTLAPSAHPRGAFLSYGNEVSYTIKMPCAGSAPKAQDLVFLFYWQALQLHQHEHIVDRANGVFEIPIAHADDDV